MSPAETNWRTAGAAARGCQTDHGVTAKPVVIHSKTTVYGKHKIGFREPHASTLPFGQGMPQILISLPQSESWQPDRLRLRII